MSVIESKLDAKEMAKGKDTKKGKGKEEKKDEKNEDPDKKLSKKELNKLKRKENKVKAVAAKAGGDTGADAAPASLEPAPMQFNTIPADLTKDLAFLESKLKTYTYLGGDSPSKLDAEYLAKVMPH